MKTYRRRILAVAFPIILLFALCGSLSSCSTPEHVRAGPPNIVIILTDDQPEHSIRYMPAVQKELAAKGVTFTNAYVTTSLCCPSRVSILTGQYVHHHGVLTNRAPVGGATAFDDSSSLAIWLQEAGYHTALMGKYLNEYNSLPEGYIPPGWDEWAAFFTTEPGKYFYYGYTLNENGRIVQYGSDPEDFSTDVLGQKAAKFIEANSNRPFFLMLDVISPHQPYYFAPRHKDLFKSYDDFFVPYRPPNYLEEDLSDKPDWLKGLEHPTGDHVEGIYQRILRSMMSVDEAVELVVETLEQERIRDQTFIIFMSDNGMAIGDHRLIGKGCPYDQCMHIPMVVSYTGRYSESRVDDRFVLNIDVAPTLLELAGMPQNASIDGQSFLPLLEDPGLEGRDGFFFEQFTDDMIGMDMTMLVPAYVGYQTRDWMFVQYETGLRELYDLQSDPFELENLGSQLGYEGVMKDFLDRLLEIRPE